MRLDIYPTPDADKVEVVGAVLTKVVDRDVVFTILSDKRVRDLYEDIVYHLDPK